MDRITKALELARHDQEENLGHDPNPTTLAKTDGLNRRAGQKSTQQRVSPAVLRKNRLVAGMENNAAADAYRLLRTRILNVMRRDGWYVLGVTSAGPQEGKSLTAANLAISMALEPDNTVLLIDADLRRPALHRLFDLEIERDLVDYLFSDMPFEQFLIEPGIERLLILPGSTVTPEPTKLLGSSKMATLINTCKNQSDLNVIIVDLPPILVGDDVLVLSPHLDAMLLVVDEGRTLENDLVRSLELLDRVKVVGTVLNRGATYAQSIAIR